MPEVDPATMRIADTPGLAVPATPNGDKSPLLHEGADEGHIAGINATHTSPIHLARRVPLSIVFLRSGSGRGRPTGQRTRAGRVLVGEVSFAAQGRARTMQENRDC